MARTKQPPQRYCAWKEDDDGNYETECGELHSFIDGGPVENRVRFCCYCGQRVKAAKNERTPWTPGKDVSGE